MARKNTGVFFLAIDAKFPGVFSRLTEKKRFYLFKKSQEAYEKRSFYEREIRMTLYPIVVRNN